MNQDLDLSPWFPQWLFPTDLSISRQLRRESGRRRRLMLGGDWGVNATSIPRRLRFRPTRGKERYAETLCAAFSLDRSTSRYAGASRSRKGPPSRSARDVPGKLSATGTTGWRKATDSDLRTPTESSRCSRSINCVNSMP